MEFEFNFGQQTLSQGIAKNTTVYASVGGVALPLANDELIFMNRDTGENHVMTNQVLHALSLCQQFKPLDQHVFTISQSIPELSNQIQAVQQVTDFLIKNNLLIEDKYWQDALSQGEPQQKVASSGIVVRTCNRPEQLQRLLQSLIKYQNKFKVKFPVQIYDDSKTQKLEQEIADVCLSFKRELNINFYGSKWQEQFVRMLKTEFTSQHDTIDWLLQAQDNIFTGGRVWNFALLNNAGKKFLFFDDDYIFEPRIVAEETKLLDLNDRPDLSVGFALSLADIRAASLEYNQDVLTQMLNNCGQTVGNWLATTDIKFNSVENLNFLELQRINASSVIKSVGNGTWGSPRANSNYWLYNLQGEQKQAFWETREIYLDNIEASNLMHYSDNYEFLSLTKFSPAAIDNSTMLPFAVPVNRVEDHFFNAVSLYCYPHQVSLHCPFMMGHIQTSKRDRASTNHIARRPNFNKFIADFALTLIDATDAINPQLRLKTLANYVMGLADSSDGNIHNRLKEYLSQIRSDMVLSMQKQMSTSPDAPVYWQADVKEIIEANGKAVLQNNAPILADWDANLSLDECIEQARTGLTQIAHAMELWPDLWAFCQTNK
ncbi:MAG: hypothetical protein L3J53_05565 [Proteobacteria bacterium]|nr:hypothetical protein [Pseudomonadota bacterium]